jgi:DNA-binding NarL/FixJ family response regulator
LRAKVVLGNALWHHDRHDDAVGELRSAQSAFEQINAVSLARHARTERRRLTARTPRGYANDAPSSAASLTRREQQVADMVRQGLTNRLIAKQLHIAEKTVEMHLSNVFAKLDVYSRAAVAALISGQDQGFASSGARRAGRPPAR